MSECIEKFKKVREDKTGSDVTPFCVQVATQGHHFLQSCLNLACMLHSNVVHFSGTRCEVLICPLGKSEKYIYRNRIGRRRYQVYVAK